MTIDFSATSTSASLGIDARTLGTIFEDEYCDRTRIQLTTFPYVWYFSLLSFTKAASEPGFTRSLELKPLACLVTL
jgi:hypothetical protein